MASYFEDFNIDPLPEGQAPDNLLHFLRFMVQGGYWRDIEDDLHQLLGSTPPPTSKEYLKSLKEEDIIVIDKDGQCPVCLKEWSKGEKSITLQCTHTFHSTCILPWLQKTNSCPVCRHEFPTDDETYEEIKKQKKRDKERKKDLETLHNSMFS